MGVDPRTLERPGGPQEADDTVLPRQTGGPEEPRRGSSGSAAVDHQVGAEEQQREGLTNEEPNPGVEGDEHLGLQEGTPGV